MTLNHLRRTPVVRAPRFTVRAHNGTFHVFDTFQYCAIDHSFQESEAYTKAQQLNARDAERRLEGRT